MRLHHIGVVVPSIRDSLGELGRFFDFKETGLPMPVATRKVNVCFLRIGEPFLELIEPQSDDAGIAGFAAAGGGIHHICFEVDDIELEVKKMVESGATLLVSPERGFDERRIAFVDLNTKTRCGLVEFLERAPPSR